MNRNIPHIPVLLEETVSKLITDQSGVYIDGTLGYGGHSEAILKKLNSSGMLLGFDLNPDAISYSENRLSLKSNNYSLNLLNFKSFSKVLYEKNIRNIQGFLLDLGLSSALIDDHKYGFSYKNDGPLDMQFNRLGKFTAKKYLNHVNENELISILRKFGEEPNAKKIAQAILQRVKIGKMKTTFDLRHAVCQVIPRRFQIKSLSRVFQAIRIKINDELNILKRTLDLALEFLSPGSRIAIISYHSLEDKLVKSFFNLNSIECVCSVKLPLCICDISQRIKKITKKAIVPSNMDIKINSRSRSAKLRIAEKL